MKILFLSHDIPTPHFSDTISLFYSIKYLSITYGHEITLISFTSPRINDKDVKEIGRFCTIEKLIPINKKNNVFNEIPHILINNIHNIPKNIRNGLLFNILDSYYSKDMKREIDDVIKKENFDIIFTTRGMANYIFERPIRKIIQPYDATYEWHRQILSRTKGLEKLIYGLSYIMTKTYEKKIYKKFDVCLVVTEKDKELLCSLSPEINCIVLPNGVDVEYFSPMDVVEDFPSLIFVSDMSGHPTTDNILYFYNEIYPYIRKEIPEIKLYLVGRNPAKEISALASDPSIIVTGTVEDVRPYLAKSSVFIAPMIMGTGIKNKVLQAMAMGKAVVATSIAAQGINTTSGKDIFITDNPGDFARCIIRLCNDEQLRENMGREARELIVSQYSWENIVKKLNKIFQDLGGGVEHKV